MVCSTVNSVDETEREKEMVYVTSPVREGEDLWRGRGCMA